MKDDILHILWVNDNPVTAENMVFMYATNALLKKWWSEVHVIIWGATTKLICENQSLQEKLRLFIEAGGSVSACKRCAENLGVLEAITGIPGIDVLYIGENFTAILKSEERVISI